jgi:hypothetical protein
VCVSSGFKNGLRKKFERVKAIRKQFFNSNTKSDKVSVYKLKIAFESHIITIARKLFLFFLGKNTPNGY